jgi:radical SAM-linked protein
MDQGVIERDAGAGQSGARHRVRLRFRKEDELRLISHRDLMTAFDRLFRRIGVSLSMSGGFHARPRMSFPLSLALGIRGRDEVFEVEFDELPDVEILLASLRASSPSGLVFTSAELLPIGTRKASVAAAACYEIAIPAEAAAGLDARIAALMAETSRVVTRENRGQRVDVRAAIESLVYEGGLLQMRLATDSAAAATKPQEVLAALELDHLLESGHYLTRTALVLTESLPPTAKVPTHSE